MGVSNWAYWTTGRRFSSYTLIRRVQWATLPPLPPPSLPRSIREGEHGRNMQHGHTRERHTYGGLYCRVGVTLLGPLFEALLALTPLLSPPAQQTLCPCRCTETGYPWTWPSFAQAAS